jgi:hypothetical protein
MNLTDRIAAAPNVTATPLPGELVLLQLETGHYYGLDEIGARSWSLLVTEGLSIGDAAARMTAEFEAELAEVQGDLLALVASLEQARLVVIPAEAGIQGSPMLRPRDPSTPD